MKASDIASWQLPLQWPRAEARIDQAVAWNEALLKAALVLAMLALTVLDRFGLRISGNFAIPPALVATYVLLAALVVAGAARLNRGGVLAYASLAGVAGLSYLINSTFEPPAHSSFASLLMLLVLYAPFTVSFASRTALPEMWHWTMRLYLGFALLVAVAGIAQYMLQFVFHAKWLFDYTDLIPPSLRASGGWNTAYAVAYWTKSNGFFLREPSIFSVAMAIALVCELSLRRRKWVMAIFGLALLLSYSGSGIVCLGLALLFPLGRGTIARVLGVFAAAALTLLILGDALNLYYTLERADEFASGGTSAYCRFVYPGVAAWQQLDSTAWSMVLGHGPGSMERMGATCADGAQTTFAKALFEYGLLGTLLIGAVLAVALNRAGTPIRIRVALGVTWLFLGGNLLAADVLLLIYVLSAMWPDPE